MDKVRFFHFILPFVLKVLDIVAHINENSYTLNEKEIPDMKNMNLQTIKKEWLALDKLPASAKIEFIKWVSPKPFKSESAKYGGECTTRIARAKITAPGYNARFYQVHVENHPFYGITWSAF